MRHARREGRVETIEVHAHIERAREHRHHAAHELAHGDDLHAEPLRLLPLMPVERPDADLHEPRRKALLHDPRERRRMRVRIALEVVVEIGVGVDVQDLQRSMECRQGAHHGKGDRVIAAKDQWHERDPVACCGRRRRHRVGCRAERGDARCDALRVGRIFPDLHVSRIDQLDLRTELGTALGRRVADVTAQDLTDARGCGGRPAPERRVDVGGDAEERDADAGAASHGSHAAMPLEECPNARCSVVRRLSGR